MWPFVSGIVSQKAKHLRLFAICNIFLIELSVQIFAYFLVGLLSHAQALGFLLHSVYKPLYVFCRCFFFQPVAYFSFFSKMSFAKCKFLILKKTNLTIVSFVCHAFSMVSNNL